MKRVAFFVVLLLLSVTSSFGQESNAIDTSRGDKMIAEYFRVETEKLRDGCLTEIDSAETWEANKEHYRSELLEMLGLDPLPEKTDLKPVVTGKVEHEEFTVENVQFQSRPGLYVTGNLSIPNKVDEKLPAILYVCGHGGVKKDGISYGNKTHYQHHGGWFARNGYVCLTIDTLQLGEIEGVHHGTYNRDRWWWLNRGYTSAGVEAWNCVRALDYLETRPEVDASRFGVTGRSGGGAYSWWIAAIDERIKCAVPVAGITDLQNHVVDGCVEGHCDCMYMVNTYRWDYAKVAALVSPRPLLISNTDTDRIFPLDGVVRTFEAVRRIYKLQGAAEKVALNITAGGHKDTQELRVHAFRWFNQHLKGDDSLIEKTAVKFFEPEQLRVFKELPGDEINTKIDETFVAQAEPQLPSNKEDWAEQRDQGRAILQEKSFAGWPQENQFGDSRDVFNVVNDGIRFRAIDFTSQEAVELRLYLVERADLQKRDLVVLNVLDARSWAEFLAEMRVAFEKQLDGETPPKADEDSFQQTKQMLNASAWTMAYVAPRGIGPTAWDQSERKQTQHQRRFYLLGQSLDGMRVWDVRRAAQTLRAVEGFADVPLWLQSQRQMAGVTLYASLFEPEITRLDLHELPASHREGPFFLNVTRYLDMPQAVAMAAERSRVALYSDTPESWEHAKQAGQLLGWDAKQLKIRKPPVSDRLP
ncbi:MAG TPA: prolyl oligopeptidase family serine peptidase [Pirellulaceae bacterium]|nr:prolyl oligopeptidase family serine peptidase [Pirellulaceae bacterium]